MKTITIEGSNIRDIPSFYDEINRAMMQAEDWRIGQSLDAFNDLLYGGFGIIPLSGPVELVWNDIAISKRALGYETTKAYYLSKLSPDSVFNKDHFRRKLEALESGEGETYFDIIMEIISDHERISLIER